MRFTGSGSASNFAGSAYYGGEPGNVEELWVFPDTDFAKLAQDMGGFGIRVHHPGEIQGALDKAVAAGKPAVVDVVSDINGIAPRAWTPSQRPRGQEAED